MVSTVAKVSSTQCSVTIEPPKPAAPCAIAIFGAAGDLTKRLLMPALYNLAQSGLLPDEFAIVGVAHTDLTTQTDDRWQRVIIEKPFGRDLASARSLNQSILKVLHENQIYRIDHYLGKETVQNLLVFRFGNGLFEPIWNRDHIDHVQITVAETVGQEKRGNYYDKAGALRDMVPNHLFQLLALTAMEPPTCFAADAVRDEKTKLFRTVQAIAPEAVADYAVRGQYGRGDRHSQDYRQEPRVAEDSNTETYVALKLLIDNWRWAGVPFYLRTGKNLPQKTTEIAIQFKQAPFAMFRDTPVECLTPNFLVLQIQPLERYRFIGN